MKEILVEEEKKNCLVNFPYFAAASPSYLDGSLMIPSGRQPTASPGLRMYNQQMPIPSKIFDVFQINQFSFIF